MKHLKAFFLLLLISFPTIVFAQKVGFPEYYPGGGQQHLAKLSFNEFGPNLFGYFEKFSDQNGIEYYKVLFSNGSRSDYTFRASLSCISPNGQPIANTNFSQRIGWSMHGSVERARTFRIICPAPNQLAFVWRDGVQGYGLKEMVQIGAKVFGL